MHPGLHYDEVFANVARIGRRLLEADSLAILLEADEGVLHSVVAQGSFDLCGWESGRHDQPPPGEALWLHPDASGAGRLPRTLLRVGFRSGARSGVVCVGYASHKEGDPGDEEFVRLVAQQVGLVSARREEHERLRHEGLAARRQARLWRSLAQLGQAVMRAEDPSQLMHQVCDIAIEYGDFRFAWVGEGDEAGGVRPIAWSGANREELWDLGVRLDPGDPRGTGPAARALREGRLCTVADLWAAPELEAWRELAMRVGVHAVAAVPVAGGTLRAVLVLYAERVGEFEDEDVRAVLTEMAQDLGFGLEVIEGRRRRIEAEEQLSLHHEIVEQAKECLVVAKVLPDGGVRFVYANPAFEEMTGYRVDEMVGRSSEMLWGPRTDREAIAAMHDVVLGGRSWSGEVYQYRKDGSEFLMDWSAVPLRDGHGRVAYILSSHRDVTERRRQSERIAHLANHDALTGLPNRRLLDDRMAHALHHARRHGHRFALAMVDLDEFKQVNDTLGHGVGDRLLQRMAHRLQQVVRAEDTIARSGGDEFILLVDTLGEREELQHVLGRVIAAVEEPTQVVGRTFTLRGSIGVAVYPEDGEDAETLLRRADIAMYAAKRATDVPFRFFSPDMEDLVAKRGDLREGIQHALERGELELHYQPQVDLVRQAIVGVEALVRWRDPEHGLRMPGEFLPAVEGTALELEIGRFVLREAVAQAEVLGRAHPGLRVAFNASARQFLASTFAGELKEALALHPTVQPSQVAIEITESAVLHDFELARQQIESCRRLGVRVALDDFGTGSSSITLLQELPCDMVKIDQRFIEAMLRMPESPAIIHGVLIMGHAMEREVLAEGVETEAQARALLRLGCHMVQGYAIARPMPCEAIDGFCGDFAERAPLVAGSELQAATETFEVLAAELGHLRWAALFTATAVAGALQPYGRHNSPRGTCCGLGYWLDTYGRSHFSDRPALADVEREHQRAHEMADQILRLQAAGDEGEVAKAADRLWRQKDDLIVALARLKS